MLSLSRLHLGQIDAGNELIGADDVHKELFIRSYINPQNIALNEFIDGNLYIIQGYKGTGKTALIRYLKEKAEKQKILTDLFLFKRDITEARRQEFSRQAGYTIVEDNTKRSIAQDFEPLWLLFLHDRIADVLPESSKNRSAAMKKYLKIIDSKEHPSARESIKIFPHLKDRKLKLKGTSKFLGFEFGVEFGDNPNEYLIDVLYYAEMCNRALADIKSFGFKFIIFLDELEVNISEPESRDRDFKSIAALVQACSKLNEIMLNNKSGGKIVLAIRHEVIRSIDAMGLELNKIAIDFGVRLDWGGPDEKFHHPIMDLINMRLKTALDHVRSEESPHFPLPLIQHPEDILPIRIGDVGLAQYVVSRTWCRPRDAIRMLRLARDVDPEARKFKDEHFIQSEYKYSQESWIEISQELLVCYSPKQLQALRLILGGLTSENMTFDNFRSIVQQRKHNYTAVASLLEKKPLEQILNDLFSIGVIGNYYISSARPIQRWSFRGDEELYFHKHFRIHPALYGVLGIVVK